MQSFDVVVINGLWLFFSYAGWKMLRKIKEAAKNKGDKVPKLFVMPHGMLDPYFQLAPERRIKAIRNYIYWHLIEKKVVNDSDGLLFTSQLELLLARKSFPDYHPKNEYNIGYGIPLPPPYSAGMKEAFLKKCPLLQGKNYLLFFGRIHPKKGVDMLVEAYLELLAKRQIKNLPVLVLAGPGMDSQFGAKIRRALALIPEAKDYVFYPGMIKGAAKWGAIYGADAFMLPSHQENFGIAVVEALACSKPVIISDQINIWEEIKKGKGGIVTEDTISGVKNMLKQWFELSAVDKKEMGENAFNVYLNNFRVERAAAKFYNVISQR
ncbi:glycosyltransferase [Mucilaginibacter calamicampi]|uniref:Glycosyltransferase n=1 Tax=Mucilaginibacter calamicampi TaxID=1302352 RepID=A0ABW2YYD7_9SPHI